MFMGDELMFNGLEYVFTAYELMFTVRKHKIIAQTERSPPCKAKVA